LGVFVRFWTILEGIIDVPAILKGLLLVVARLGGVSDCFCISLESFPPILRGASGCSCMIFDGIDGIIWLSLHACMLKPLLRKHRKTPVLATSEIQASPVIFEDPTFRLL
jgi:hypothetical protein